jgi:hypothetical protein
VLAAVIQFWLSVIEVLATKLTTNDPIATSAPDASCPTATPVVLDVENVGLPTVVLLDGVTDTAAVANAGSCTAILYVCPGVICVRAVVPVPVS